MSGLNFQTVPVAFTQGLDTRTQPKLVVAGKWAQLDNMSLSEDNTPRLRDGIAGASAVNGNSLALRGDELLMISGADLYSYSAGLSALQKISKLPFGGATGNQVANVLVSTQAVHASSGTSDQHDVALARGSGATNDVALVVWRELGSGIAFKLVDTVSGSPIHLSTNEVVHRISDAQANCPRVIGDANGGYIVAWMTSTGGNQLKALAVETDGTVGTVSSTIGVSPQMAVTQNFDACLAGGHMYVTYLSSGTDSVIAVVFARSGTTVSVNAGPAPVALSSQVGGVTAIQAVNCRAFAGGLVGVFMIVGSTGSGSAGNGIIGATMNGVGQMVAPTRIFNVPFGSISGGHVASTNSSAGAADLLSVFYDFAGFSGQGPSLQQITRVDVDATMTVALSVSPLVNAACSDSGGAPATSEASGPQGPWICGRPFTCADGVTMYLPCYVTDPFASQQLQNTFFLLDGMTGAVVAKALYGAFQFPTANYVGQPPASSLFPNSGSEAWMPGPVTELSLDAAASNNAQVSSINVTGTTLVKMTPTGVGSLAPLSLPTAQLGPVAFIGGGLLSAYDGEAVYEHGFNLWPGQCGLATAATGGVVTDGVHQVVAVYEWFDAQGQRHQSSPSVVSTITTAGGNLSTITVTWPNLMLTKKQGVAIAIYMTTQGGITFNRAGSVGITNNSAQSSLVVSISDAALQSNEALYTEPDAGGTTLPNDAPPPPAWMCVVQNRLWMLDADDPDGYRYSQELLPSGFGLQFSGEYGDVTLGGRIPSDGGKAVCIAAMDEKTIILCSRKPYVVFGQGPDSSGNNNGFGEPQEIPSDVGCVEARSVLSMPLGLVFKSRQGWHLLGRDLSVNYIGAGAAAFDANDVTGCALVEDRKECRFTSSSGTTLVLSYLGMVGGGEPAWSTFSVRGTTYAVRDTCYWPTLGAMVHVSATQGLNKDVPGKLIDDAAGIGTHGIAWTARTSFLAMGKLEGFQRVRRLYITASAPASPTVEVDVAVDFDDAYGGLSPGAYSFSIDTTNEPVIATGLPVDYRHKLAHQKCKSVAFTFSSNAAGDETLAPITGFQAMALEVGLKKGVRKLGAAQTVG